MGNYLSNTGDKQVKTYINRLTEAKKTAQNLMTSTDKELNALASYFAALKTEEILNNHGQDIDEKEGTKLTAFSTIRGYGSDISRSEAFKEITKDLTAEKVNDFSNDPEKLQELYNQYEQSTLKKATEPKYTILSPEQKEKKAAEKAAAQKVYDEDIQRKKQAREEREKKAAEEKAVRDKKDAKAKAAQDKKDAKAKAAQDKKDAKAEKKKLKQQEKERKKQEKQRQKEEKAKKKAEEKAEKEKIKKQKAEEKKKQKDQAAKAKQKQAKPAKQAEKKTPFDPVADINNEYANRLKENQLPILKTQYSNKQNVAIVLQTEISKNDALANSKQYKNHEAVVQKISAGAVLRDANKLCDDKKFNQFYESLDETVINAVLHGHVNGESLNEEFEYFKTLKVKEPEKAPEIKIAPAPAPKAQEPVKAETDVEHYKGVIAEGIQSQRIRIDNTLNDDDMDPQDKRKTLEKSVANIMTYKAMDMKLDEDGANMTKAQMQELCNNKYARTSRDKLMQDSTFKELCGMLKEEDYQAIANDEVDGNTKYLKMFREAQMKSKEITAPEKAAPEAPEKKNQGPTL